MRAGSGRRGAWARPTDSSTVLFFLLSRHHSTVLPSSGFDFYRAVSGWMSSFSARIASASFPLRQLMKREKAQ